MAFHRKIADASHNQIFGLVLDLVNDKLLASRRETQRSSGGAEACHAGAHCGVRGDQEP